MNIVDVSVLLVASLLAVYSLASAIECGIVLSLLSRYYKSRAMFTPLWEITNVFLVFGFTALGMLFNGALTQLSHALIATLGVALFTMLARACLVLGIFYIKDEDSISNFLTWLFAVATFLVPLTFAAAGVYLLTGHLFYQTLLGGALMAAALAGLAGVGLSLVARRKSQRKLLPGELVLGVWYLLLGCVIPLSVTHSASSLNQNTILAVGVMSGIGLALTLLNTMGLKVIKTWQFSILACLGAPILLAWANRPFLISGKLTLDAAYGAAAYGRVVVAGLIIMLPIIVLGGWLFVKLLPHKKV